MLAPKTLADENLRRILRKARKSSLRDWAILELLAATGLRVSEAMALLCSDLGLNGKTGWVTMKMGKGQKTRHVPVNEKAAEVLKEHLAAEDLSGGAPLFSSRFKKPMTPLCNLGLGEKIRRRGGG